jgi:hypothetical protein
MTLRAGTPEVEVDPALGRRPDEPVIVKKYAVRSRPDYEIPISGNLSTDQPDRTLV